jgi:hypothetical protein
MRQMIIQSIRNRELIGFNYDGYPRTVEPHAYGVTSKGKEVLRAYQIAGGSSSGAVRSWRLFEVSRMNGFHLDGDGFSAPRQGYSRNDSAMETIYAQI